MNVSQYSLNEKLAHDAIASLSMFASIEESIVAAGERAAETPELQHAREQVQSQAKNMLVDGAALSYCLDGGNGICILSGVSDESAIEVPTAIEGRPVTGIGAHAFSTCYALERIGLPDTVSVIGKFAFMNTALSEFNAPCNLRSLGENAFYKCTRLQRVRLNDGLQTIGSNAFRESALSAIFLPASVRFVGQNAFKDTGIAFGDNATLVIDPTNDNLLLDNGALYARDESGELTLIQLLDENTSAFTGRSGTTFVASKAFLNARKLERAALPEGTLGVGDKAFKGCYALTSIELPNTLRSLGKLAFQNTQLRELRIPDALSRVGAGAFYTGGSIARKHTPTIERIDISPRNTSFFMHDNILCHRNPHGGTTALLYVGDAEHLVIPREVTAIGMYAFLNCSTIKSVEIHDELKSIDVGGLDTGRSITTVVYNVYAGRDQPQERFVVNYPPGQAGREAAKLTFSRGEFSLPYAFAAADDAILATQDTCLRDKAILERLRDPVMLGESTRAAFKRRLRRAVPATVVAFGKCGFPQGIDMLYEEGVIHADNIDALIEAASDANEIAVLSRLLELKRTAFDARLFDFEL